MTSTNATWFKLAGGVSAFEDDERPCWLAGIECAACGQTWAMVGMHYPTVSRADLPRSVPDDSWPVSPETFAPILAALTRCFDDRRPLAPGASFGPRTSRLRRLPPDLLHDGTSFLISERVAADPELAGLGLRLARTPVRTMRGKEVVLYELEMWAVAQRRLPAARRNPAACPVCGYVDRPNYRNEPLLAASLTGHHAVRLADVPAVMFVSDALRAVLARYAAGSELTFEPIRVVGEQRAANRRRRG